MSVDYDVNLIYGFKLNTHKVFERYCKDVENFADKSFPDWLDEKTVDCMFIGENCYIPVIDDNLYFGIEYSGIISSSSLAEFEADYFETVVDEFISIFGDFDVLADTQSPTPELHAAPFIY
jgi:hypothetical protein